VKMRSDRMRHLVALAALSAIMLTLAGCSGSETASKNHNNNPNTAELFTVPADQMAHVQVLTVQPTTLSRTLRLTGSVAYNSFHTTPVITQVSGPVSRIVVVPGQHVDPGKPMLYVARACFINRFGLTTGTYA